jgi:PKD repeat protein
MQKLFVVLGLALSLVAQARNADPVKSLLQGLGKSLIERQTRQLGQPLVKIDAGQAVQGNEFNAFIRPVSDYSGSYVVIDATLDGAVVSLEHPSQDLWIFSDTAFEKIAQHTLAITVSLENAAQADQLSAALISVQQQIQSLQAQIASTTDQNQLAQLNLLLNQQIALQSQISTSLASLKNPVGSQAYTFNVAPAPSSSGNFPRISSITPIIGVVSGGDTVTIHGANFVNGATVMFGDLPGTNVSFIDSSTITASTPVFTKDGVVDVAVSLPIATGETEAKNALLQGAFYATSAAIGGIANPVAVSGTPQSTVLGTTVTLDGSQSAAPSGHSLSYAWSLISAPAGSGLPIGSIIGTGAALSVTPDFPGNFVYQLLVTDSSTHTVSAPSLTVVTATLASAALSATAPSITVIKGGTSTSQISVTDANSPYLKFNYYISQSSLFGRSTVSQSGLVTYYTTTAAVADVVGVTVLTNSNPAVAFTVNIPISVIAYNMPSATNIGCSIQSMTVPYIVGCSPNVPVAGAAPIASYLWNFGDGTPSNFSPFSASVPGGIKHDYYNFGTYLESMGMADTNGSTAYFGYNFPVVAEALPINSFKLNGYSGTAPFTVTANASASHALNGSITTYKWIWGDGVTEAGNGAAFITRSHTYSAAGIYSLQLWLIDSQGGNTQLTTSVYVSRTPPASGAPPSPFINVTSPREQVVGSTFNFDGATYSNDPNNAGSVTAYSWSFADPVCAGQPSCSAATATASHAYSQPANAFVLLQETSSTGAVSAPVTMEVLSVVRGHAPRARFRLNGPSGIAPFQLTADGSTAYDYDGSLVSYVWNWGDGSPTSTGVNGSHTFVSPGTYFVSLSVTDNDGNVNTQSTSVSVTATAALHVNEVGGDSDQTADLASACGMGSGLACDALANVYAANGDSFTSQNLRSRACSLGYTQDCSGK